MLWAQPCISMRCARVNACSRHINNLAFHSATISPSALPLSLSLSLSLFLSLSLSDQGYALSLSLPLIRAMLSLSLASHSHHLHPCITLRTSQPALSRPGGLWHLAAKTLPAGVLSPPACVRSLLQPQGSRKLVNSRTFAPRLPKSPEALLHP